MPLTPSQTATLKNAILADAALATFVTAGNDASIADYYSSATATLIAHPSLPVADFFAGIASSLTMLNASTATIQGRWDRVFRVIGGMGNIKTAQVAFQAILTLMVNENLMTQAAVDALTKRPATRAENLLGVGVVIHHLDVAQALRG